MEIGYKGGYIGMKCELRYVAHGYNFDHYSWSMCWSKPKYTDIYS